MKRKPLHSTHSLSVGMQCIYKCKQCEKYFVYLTPYFYAPCLLRCMCNALDVTSFLSCCTIESVLKFVCTQFLIISCICVINSFAFFQKKNYILSDCSRPVPINLASSPKVFFFKALTLLVNINIYTQIKHALYDLT